MSCFLIKALSSASLRRELHNRFRHAPSHSTPNAKEPASSARLINPPARLQPRGSTTSSERHLHGRRSSHLEYARAQLTCKPSMQPG